MAERLEEEGDRMLQEIEDDREDIDALFAELDANLEESRKVKGGGPHGVSGSLFLSNGL